MADRDRFGGRSLPTETIREDIGFQGPHSDFNESITEQFPQISLPSYDEGRGGRGNYQGSTIPPWYLDEVTSYDIFNPTENYGPAGSGITSLGENYVPPPWWETQMGGKAYGPFHKFGPEDYSDMFKLEPGQNYSYTDLIGNKMLNPHDYFVSGSPYKRDNPLMQATQESVGSEVPDHLIYDNIYDDEGSLEGYSWNPYKEENSPLINEWLPEEYAISPGVSDRDDIFQFRDFPWMEEDTGGWLSKLFKELGTRAGVAQGLGSMAPRAPLGMMPLGEWN